jgi:predicted dehydrogenase
MDGVETDSLEEALSHRPAFAIISSPTALHIPVSLAAARAGCHLFIEKPVSHSLEGCEELLSAAKDGEVVTMVGCQFRFHPHLISLRKQLRNGRIGTALSARAEWGEYLPDWHPNEDHRLGYSARADLGGGAILTLIHPLDYLYWLFGAARQVHASARKIDCLETSVGDDLAEITIEFCSGVVGQVHLDYIQRPPVHTLTIIGDKGRVEWDCHPGTLRWTNAVGETETETEPAGFERNTMFIDEMKHFLECIEGLKPTRIPLGDGIAVLDLALRAKASALAATNA